jgi:hypothetical protein
MNRHRTLPTVLRFLVGFLGAMAATAALGFGIVATLRVAAPQWGTTWANAGSTQKALWIALPTVALFGGIAWLLWSKHRAIAVGVIVYTIADAAVTMLGR